MAQNAEPRAGSSPTRRILVALATVTGNLYLIFGSLFFGSLAILLSWVPPRGNWVFQMARMWSWGLLLSSGVRLGIRTPPNPEHGTPRIYMSNHQSLFDIPALIVTLPGQSRFLAKRSLFKIPVFGWALSAGGFIPIDREDRSRARESFQEAVERLRRGSSTVIFPEGTRSLDGCLGSFERGGFLLALKSEMSIVPVWVDGSIFVRRRGSFRIQPGRIDVSYGRPIDVRDYTVRRRRDLESEVRRQMESLAGPRTGDPGVKAAMGEQHVD